MKRMMVILLIFLVQIASAVEVEPAEVEKQTNKDLQEYLFVGLELTSELFGDTFQAYQDSIVTPLGRDQVVRHLEVLQQSLDGLAENKQDLHGSIRIALQDGAITNRESDDLRNKTRQVQESVAQVRKSLNSLFIDAPDQLKSRSMEAERTMRFELHNKMKSTSDIAHTLQIGDFSQLDFQINKLLCLIDDIQKELARQINEFATMKLKSVTVSE